MNRFLPALAALFLLIAPALAQPLSSDAILKQTQAIAISVQRQLMACWNLPEDAEGVVLSLDIVFYGDGRLDRTAALSPGQGKIASKFPALADSIMAAVRRCTPFAGLEALGAGRTERFSVTIHFQS
ncbi:MAG: hypothetical protein KIS86_15535 [Devosia sp.]|nr:hypothetical protein [Devosia sp.]